MHFSAGAVAVWCLTVGTATAFSNSAFSTSPAFVSRSSSVSTTSTHAPGCVCAQCASGSLHAPTCACAACTSTRRHGVGCACAACRSATALFSTVEESDAAPAAGQDEENVPAEVVAMDGIESPEEAHNAERPARQQIKARRRPQERSGTELSELEIGAMVPGKVKSVTAYGAFVDIGAQTDGLLHISQLAAGYVSRVQEIVKEGDDVTVRIISIDTGKNQIALSMMTADEADKAAQQQQESRPRRQSRSSAPRRRDDSFSIEQLQDNGWDTEQFVEGTVVGTLDFGCFVRVDISDFNEKCEGELDGLVHISAMGSGRIGSVTDVVNVDDKVQVRLKSISGNKVSLTMLSAEDESSKSDARAPSDMPQTEGAKDWKESLYKMQTNLPKFFNGPIVVDRR